MRYHVIKSRGFVSLARRLVEAGIAQASKNIFNSEASFQISLFFGRASDKSLINSQKLTRSQGDCMQTHLQRSCCYATYKETDLIRNFFADLKWPKVA